MSVHQGMNLREALRYARQNGCEIQVLRRTGEISLWHPTLKTSVKQDKRRKDATRLVVNWLRTVPAKFTA